MKKLLLIAAAAVMVLSSCSNNEDIGTTPDNGAAIGFRSFIDKGTGTRATITDADNILGFTVTGWWDRNGVTNDNADSPAPGEPTDVFPGTAGSSVPSGTFVEGDYLFNATDITRREASIDDWTYSPVMYWPKKGNGVYFFAYSPASSKNVTSSTSGAAKGLKNYDGSKLTYIVPDPSLYDAQEDFLLARTGQQGYHIDDQTTPQKVKLNFVHALSRVKFTAKTTRPDVTYIIHSIELVNVYKEGEIDMQSIPTDGTLSYSKGNQVVKWEDYVGSRDNVKLDLGDAPLYLDDDYKSLQGATNGLMVLPQATELYTGPNTEAPAGTDEFAVRVEYKAFIPAEKEDDYLYYAGGKDSWKSLYFPVVDPFHGDLNNNTTPLTFEMGRQYNFRLTFGTEAGNPIKFEVDVSQWTDALVVPVSGN